MKASTLGIFRRSPAAYELYAENNPELTRIKVAEHYVRNKGMVDFYRHTTKTAMTAAILVMVATLAALSGIGFRTITHSTANKYAFESSLDNLVQENASIEEIRMVDYSNYYIYVDDSVWNGFTQSEKSAYCLALADSLNDACHSYHILGSRKQAQVFFYDPDGNLLAQPSEDSWEHTVLQ